MMHQSIHVFVGTLLALLFLLPVASLQAQPGRTCGTPEKAELYATPEGQLREMAFENRINAWILQNQMRRSTANVDFTIPTVIHVIQSTTTDSISDACLHSQIEVLNEDFQKLNADTSLIPADFLPVLGNGSIEFCLATRDPNGNPTSGITRTVSPAWAEHDYNDEDSLKALIQWPPTQYLNIWVPASIANNLLGYATFPNKLATEPESDGVVINGNHMGRGSCANAPYDRGRTATHEVGHWLGVFHTFAGGGCQGTNASTCGISGDNICDTPPVSGSTFGCPGVKNTCTETPVDQNDMTMNFMDYVHDTCMYMFTAGQVMRMHAVLGTDRSVISSGSNHTATGCACSAASPCAPLAGFSANRTSICPGQTVTFIDQSSGPATSWLWTFPGGNPANSTQQSPVVTYPNSGAYPVQLAVTNAIGSDTVIQLGYVTVNQVSSPPLVESFESVLPSDWMIENTDNAGTWTITGAAASLGSQSIFIDNWNYDALGTTDAVVSGAIDLRNFGAARLGFDYAYQEALANHDTLEIYLSSDCGVSWNLAWKKGGNDLATVPGPGIATAFVPVLAGEWASDSIDLSSYLGNSGFKAKFQNIGYGGNTLWLDNINMSGIVGISDPKSSQEIGFDVSPNPFSDRIEVHFETKQKSEVAFALFDLHGRVILNLDAGWKAPGEHRWAMPESVLGQLPPGIYFLRISASGRSKAVKMVKMV